MPNEISFLQFYLYFSLNINNYQNSNWEESSKKRKEVSPSKAIVIFFLKRCTLLSELLTTLIDLQRKNVKFIIL